MFVIILLFIIIFLLLGGDAEAAEAVVNTVKFTETGAGLLITLVLCFAWGALAGVVMRSLIPSIIVGGLGGYAIGTALGLIQVVA